MTNIEAYKALLRDPFNRDTLGIVADILEENGDIKGARELRKDDPYSRQYESYSPSSQIRTAFSSSIIGQHDDEDYSESGYVAVRVGDWCAIAAYGHCSCYDTWTDITGGDISDDMGSGPIKWDWQGTYAELLDMARRVADPAMPERDANPDDSDYDHLVEMYRQVLEKAN